MLPKLKYPQNCKVTKTEMALKPKIQREKMSQKLKFYQDLNFAKTEMSLNFTKWDQI